MRTPFAFIFRAGQREALSCLPSLASMVSAECEYNLVCGSSRKTLSVHAQGSTSLHTKSNAGSWSSDSTGDKRCEEEKSPVLAGVGKAALGCP